MSFQVCRFHLPNFIVSCILFFSIVKLCRLLTVIIFAVDDIPLEGTLPYTAISNFKRLEYFGVEDCDLYGRMPLFTGLTNLKKIRMGGNSISGSIPRSIGELANLEVLELWENDLYGTIPSFSGNQNALRSLDLNENFGIVGSLGDLFRNLPTSVSKFWCEECRYVRFDSD